MAASKTQRYHHGDLRRVLIDGAARLIARRRDVAFTLRELAQSAQVSHAAAYRHFASKADILAAVAEVGFARLHDDFVAVSAPLRRDAKRELRALGLAYVQFALRHQGFYRAMFNHELGDHHAYPSLVQAADAAFRSLLDAVTRGVEQGSFRRRPPRELAVFAWSAVHGLASLLIDGRLAGDAPAGKPDEAALSELVVDSVVRGLLA